MMLINGTNAARNILSLCCKQTYIKLHSSVKCIRTNDSILRLHSCSKFSTVSKFTLTERNRTVRLGKWVIAVASACVGMKILLINCECQAATEAEDGDNIRKTAERKSHSELLAEAVSKSRDLLQRIKDEASCPGVVVAVGIDGNIVWAEGLGYADIENRVPCTPETVMRIASISKPVTTTIAGKLMEAGLLDIDKPVQEYVPKFPEKFVDGAKVTLTTRLAMSHLAGIRHYSKDYMKKGKKDEKEKDESKTTVSEDAITKEMAQAEYYIKKHFNSVYKGMDLFQDDPLVHKPGSKFLYTTHGYTLVSAVLEGASKKTFKELCHNLFKDLGLQNTYLDENTPIIYNRSRYYIINKKGHIVNAPYVDNSYKWAGGGLLSTVGDLVKFGNVMLYSYQYSPEKSQNDSEHKGDNSVLTSSKIDSIEMEGTKQLPGYLNRETVKEIWRAQEKTTEDKCGGYGLGWRPVPEKRKHGCCTHPRSYVSHTGGAVGASSVLLIVPIGKGDNPPSGVVVALMTNMIAVSLEKTARKIAQEFESVKLLGDTKYKF